MPVYIFKCGNCGEKKDIICSHTKISEQRPKCKCNKIMERSMIDELSNPFVYAPYWDENLTDNEHPHGIYLTSHKQKKEFMRKTNHEYAV